MRRVSTAIIALGLLIGGTSAASAGELGPPLTVDPSSGPPGTEYEVSGEDCAPEAQPAAAGFAVTRVVVTAEQSTPSERTVFPGSDGSWSTTFTANADAEGELAIQADCERVATQGQSTAFFQEPEYEFWFRSFGTFTVTQPVEDTTTTTSEPTPPTSEPPESLPDSTPAPAVVARPTFTG